MGSGRLRLSGIAMNTVLAVLGVLVIFLVYGLVTRFSAPRVDPHRDANPAQLVGEIIQVEVRNGCGVTGLAARTTMYLRRHGFDVVEVGDYRSFDEERSKVIDRVGDLASAMKVATILGIPEEQVVQEIRLDYFLDATIVIGKDYATLRPFGNEE